LNSSRFFGGRKKKRLTRTPFFGASDIKFPGSSGTEIHSFLHRKEPITAIVDGLTLPEETGIQEVSLRLKPSRWKVTPHTYIIA
jgi:hypothetical protein